MKRRRITAAKFREIVHSHADWLTFGFSGPCARANLSNVDLRHIDVKLALIQYADLSFSDLRGVDLSSSYLVGVNLACADLRGANLKFTDLNGATLVGCLVDLDAVLSYGFSLAWWLKRGAIIV